ncbi:MAG: isochorismatase family protein [Elusimicrobia bacterium]|nr:isochorismatase family protein [Elusimicrobiota bacterium]
MKRLLALLLVAALVVPSSFAASKTAVSKTTVKDLLTDQNSVLVLVDYQPGMFKGIDSGNRTTMKNAAVSAAKAASILKVPVVLTSIYPQGNGEFLKDITDLFPNQEVIARKVPGFDAFDDERVWAAVKKTGRKKIVISGLWTSMCFAYTAIHGLREGYEVYGIMDAAGDASLDAHKYGIERMMQAGVVPITLISLVSEWMHDWQNPKAGELINEVYSKYNAMLGM